MDDRQDVRGHEEQIGTVQDHLGGKAQVSPEAWEGNGMNFGFRISDFGLRRLIEVQMEEKTIGRAIEQRFDQIA